MEVCKVTENAKCGNVNPVFYCVMTHTHTHVITHMIVDSQMF